MKRTLQSVLLFIVTTIHALAWAAPNLKAECSGTPCANTLTGENPGQVAQRHSDELNATIRASDDDKKRWSRFVIYADSTALEDLQLELHKKSGLKLELFPSKGDLKFSRPGMAQIFHIAAPRKSTNDPCPEYDLKVLDASADHAVIRKTCPTYEYRPGRRYRDASFTRVRYVHPSTARITTAWVSTSDLEDPFSESETMHPRVSTNFDKMDPRELPTIVPIPAEQREHLALITQTMRQVIENKRSLEESDSVFGAGKFSWPKNRSEPIKTALWFGVENFRFRSISVTFNRKTSKSSWESAVLSVHPRNFPTGVYSMSLPKTFFANLVSTATFPQRRENESVTDVNVFEFSLQSNANIKFRFEARPDVSSVSEKYPRSFHALTISVNHDNAQTPK